MTDDDEEGDSHPLHASPYTIVKSSGIHAKGVFAARFIPKGTVIYLYEGERISSEEAFHRLERDKTRGLTYLFELDDDIEIDGEVGGNDSIYINHCCDPNCNFSIVGREIRIHTIKDVQEGEELTYDYHFAADLGPLNAVCRCGSPKCRGYIVAASSLHELRRRLPPPV